MTKLKVFTVVFSLILIFSLSGCGIISDLIKSDPIKQMLQATVEGPLELAEGTEFVQPTTEEDVLILTDDFSDSNSGWSVFSDDFGSADYVDGAYQVSAIQENEYNWGVAGQYLDDIRIEVDVNVDQTNSIQNDGYGVDCRIQDNGDGYGFRISSDGYVAIELYSNDENTALVNWEYNDAVFTDGQTNHLTAICKGSQLTFIVNDIQVATVQDGTFSAGDLALTVVSFETEPVIVRFDNLEVYTVGGSTAATVVDNDYTLEIYNPTEFEICGLFIVPSEEEYWDINRLEGGATIAAGESKTFENLPSSSVDVRAETCDYFTVNEGYEIDLYSTSSYTLSGPRLLLHQPFDDLEGWPSGVMDGGMITNSNGDVYSVTVSEAEKLVTATSDFSGQDLILFAKASLVKTGGGGMGIYGITCRMRPDGSGIFFAIRGDGMASIIGVNKGEMEQLTDWTSSDYIHGGVDTNSIEANCLGSEYTLLVNGDYSGFVEDTRYQNGKVGVAVFSPAGESTQADFDYLDVYAGE